jgi:membrane protein implicated in regulation of membrane protease activity
VTRARALVSIIALILFAAYSMVVVVVALSAGKGHGPVFWVSIVVIILLAAAALWLSRRIYRRRYR